MTLVQFIFIITTVMALSIGQVLFKAASSSLNFLGAEILYGLLNIKLLAALMIYGFATIMWLYVLKTTPLRIAYPFMALAFLIVLVLANLFLGESMHWNTFAGAVIIGFGVWLSVLCI